MSAPNGTLGLPELASTPSAPAAGTILFYTKTDGNAYILNSSGVESAIGSTAAITALTGDVTATGPGSAATTVAFVGGQTAANVAYAVVEVDAATNANTPSTLVKRDASGNFIAGTITAFLNGNATTSTSAVSAIDFTGTLNGDVTGTQSATVVSFVDGQTASAVAGAVVEVNAATPNNMADTLVYRDASGNFQAGTITAALIGNVTGNVSGSSSTFTGSLSGDVTGTQSATSVVKIQGTTVNSTVPTDAQILIYNSTSTQWTPESISGDVSLANSGAMSIASTVVTGKSLTGYVLGANTPISATDSILSAFEKVQGQLGATMGSAITALTGDGTATGPGSVPFTLATVNSNVGSFGDQTTIAAFTVNGKGLITAASNVTIGNLTNSNLSGSAGITGANIASSTISNTNLAQMSANTVKANTSGIPANPVDTALGTVTEATSAVLTLTGWADATIGSPTIQVLQATTSESGYLSSTDWNVFNSKQTAGNYITALTGDVTATGPGSVAATVASIQGTVVSGTTGTGDVVFSNSPTLVTPTLGTPSAIVLTNGTGLPLTTGVTGVLPIANGGTNNSAAYTAGSIIFSNGTALTQDNANFYWNDSTLSLGIGIQPEANTTIDIVNNSGSPSALQQTSYSGGSGFRGRYANGTLASPTAVVAGNIINYLSARGYGASQFAASSTGSVNIVAGETFTNTSNATYLTFTSTPTGSVTSAESMRVASTGVTLGPQSSSTAIHTTNGGMIRTTRTITTNLTVDSGTTDDIILCNQSGAITITLPTPTVGRTIVIKDISGNAQTNNISVAQHASETIEGLAVTKVLYTNYGAWTFTVDYDGNWWMC